ncbi:ficolin-2-like [Branchiostoma lanceolatum]|uniref:ficolin-2-like n=1 Tax=Branchiostoma lanceolatum TaxID=7740 RepID=UPI003455E393
MDVRQPGRAVLLVFAALLVISRPPPVGAAPALDPQKELRVLNNLIGKVEKTMSVVGRGTKTLDKILTDMESRFDALLQNVTRLEQQRDGLMELSDSCGLNDAPLAGDGSTAAREADDEGVTAGPATTAEAPRVKDCEELLPYGLTQSGVYTIYVDNRPVRVFCRLEDGVDAWTVIQRRQDGSVNFNRSWADYKTGFGDPAVEYWLGNEVIHQITNSGDYYTLYIYMEDWDPEDGDAPRHIQFDEFYLDSAATGYTLRLNLLRGGNIQNAMYYNTGQPFTTYDRDNGGYGANCAKRYGGGWWYYGHACVYANLNGNYVQGGHTQNGVGLVWLYWRSPDWYSAKVTEMRIMKRDASIPVRQP